MVEKDNYNVTIQSKAIDFLRFPMAVMVVFIHQPSQLVTVRGEGDLLSNIVVSASSHVLAHIAVPLFFFISGFLYFYNLREWDNRVYIAKTKKRIKTLFVPYICWNIICWLVSLFILLSSTILMGKPISRLNEFIENTGSYHIFWDISHWEGSLRLFGLLEPSEITGPYHLPLWFLRNLIVLVLCTPIIYYLINRAGKWFLGLLCLCYLSNTWIAYSPLHVTGFFFFSLGGYLSINHINIIDVFGNYRKFTYCFTVIIGGICVGADVMTLSSLFSILLPLFRLLGVVSTYCIMYQLIESGRYTTQIPILAQASFFVFASHYILINHYGGLAIKKLFSLSLPFAPHVAHIIGYLVIPVVVSLLCVCIYAVMKKYMPTCLSMLTGGR